jgi:hypothetical protein
MIAMRGCNIERHKSFHSVFRGRFQMNISGRFAAGIAILISLGFIAADYLFHHSHVTHFFLYSWMVLYFLFALAVTIFANLAFQVATASWSSLSKAARSSQLVGGWIVTGLLTWLAFWRQHFFLWMVFALTLVATFWIQFNEWHRTPRTQ